MANNKLPTPKDVAPIAKRLVNFYKATKDELSTKDEAKTKIQNYGAPEGVGKIKTSPD